MPSHPKIVGLTGGIASGKSTVAQFLREADIPVVDADKLGHIALSKTGAAYKPVIEAFGTDILDADGEIDRQKLGAKVFDDPTERATLEGITHPAIGRLSAQSFEIISQKGAPLAFYEAALLVETGVYRGMDALVVVACSVENQVRRVMARDGLGKEAAAARIASQFPLQEKISKADYVIENDSSIDEVRIQSLDVLQKLREKLIPKE